jgi:hypothetical protein
MTTFNPSVSFTPGSPSFDPPDRPDQLAESVLASLSRPRWGYRSRPWGPIKTFILGALTGGLLPLLIWPRRLRNLMIVEQQQLWHLAEWLRLRTGKPEATALRDESAALGPAAAPSFLPLLLAILAVLALLHLTAAFNFNPDHFRRLLYTFPDPSWRSIRNRPYTDFWRQWTLLISAGYLIHWLQVRHHARRLRQYVKQFNAITAAEGIGPVWAHRIGIGFHPLWAILAIVGIWRGAFWAVPMALAGVAHARYVRITSRGIRGQLAGRVKTMLMRHRPALNLRPTPNSPPPLPCVNERCRSPLPPGSQFCPRCGTRA